MFTKALWVSRNAERSKGTSTELYSYAIIQGKEEKFGQEEKTKEKSFIVGIMCKMGKNENTSTVVLINLEENKFWKKQPRVDEGNYCGAGVRGRSGVQLKCYVFIRSLLK